MICISAKGISAGQEFKIKTYRPALFTLFSVYFFNFFINRLVLLVLKGLDKKTVALNLEELDIWTWKLQPTTALLIDIFKFQLFLTHWPLGFW